MHRPMTAHCSTPMLTAFCSNVMPKMLVMMTLVMTASPSARSAPSGCRCSTVHSDARSRKNAASPTAPVCNAICRNWLCVENVISDTSRRIVPAP